MSFSSITPKILIFEYYANKKKLNGIIPKRNIWDFENMYLCILSCQYNVFLFMSMWTNFSQNLTPMAVKMLPHMMKLCLEWFESVV